ncbi:non-hydrolyzing UDP-N-acetylglucosamine 2-epimerase [Spirosoma harenae]
MCVVGTRPNFIKMAPLYRALIDQSAFFPQLIHTGQHSDALMSDVFFQQLNLPQPDYFLNIGSGTITQQTSNILEKFEPVLDREYPDWVLVVGDVTSTFACALGASNKGIRVGHIEAGLRSGDKQMPEERNRILTDGLSDLLFVSEESGIANLQREGINADKIHFVGNILIDALAIARHKATELNTIGRLELIPKTYVLMTMHRASNVDTEAGLLTLLRLIETVASVTLVLFSMHPRTQSNLVRFDLISQFRAIPNVRLVEPQGYLEFLNLTEYAALVITDSGGIQEETTYLKVPCLTFRQSTERPITVELGTNELIADLNPATVQQKVIEILEGRSVSGKIPPFWDGQTANRIAQILINA